MQANGRLIAETWSRHMASVGNSLKQSGQATAATNQAWSERVRVSASPTSGFNGVSTPSIAVSLSIESASAGV